MSDVAALRGPVPGPPPAGSPAAMRMAGDPLEFRAPRSDDRLLHPLAARAFAFFALLAFGAAHWMRMLEPPAPERAWYAALAAAAVVFGLVLAARLSGALRAAATLAALLAGTAIAIVGAGVADELLLPGRWGALADGIARGVESLPGARVPYRGLDEWLRAVIPMGGTMLAVVAAALAFWPRRHGRAGFVIPALLALVALYAVPAVALIFDAEFMRGAVLAILVIAFLHLERLRRRDARAAAVAGALSAVLALAVAPTLDRLDPWWDYETWALSAASSRSTTFAWDHDYQALTWPRDGRELLRVKARQRSYWKADQLDDFDGVYWVRGNSAGAGRTSDAFLTEGVDTRRLARWEQQISVSVRSLRSETFVTAGTVESIRMPGRAPQPTERLGIFRTSRTLRRGDAYKATVYLPTPNPTEMRAAPINDLGIDELQQFRRFRVYGPETDFTAQPPSNLTVRAFKADPVIPGLDGEDIAALDVIESSPQARVWALAQELRRGARTPYDYLRRVERHLESSRFSYAERPPAASSTLDGFLFETRIGFCQQYSGAMALLLRMGGVPARVATGFSPGSFNKKTGEFVVRDYDAHSWVEAWFAGIGWVPFDPTPASAPPRSQAAADTLGSAALGDVSDLGTTTLDPRVASTEADGSLSWATLAGGLAGLVALLVAGRFVRRRLRRRAERPAVLELERALRIAGGGVAPETTLAALERRFAGSPSALGYLRALRAQRFAPAATGPTLAQRRALRSALGRGHGPLGHLRSWWALPPRVRG